MPGEAATENGIVAAMQCAEMATKYRRWAHDLAILIEAHKEAGTGALMHMHDARF